MFKQSLKSQYQITYKTDLKRLLSRSAGKGLIYECAVADIIILEIFSISRMPIPRRGLPVCFIDNIRNRTGSYSAKKTFTTWCMQEQHLWKQTFTKDGRGPYTRVVVSTAFFQARIRASVPGLCCLKETKMFLPHLLYRSVTDQEPYSRTSYDIS